MRNGTSWPAVLIMLLCVACLVFLIADARGRKHYRGDELGSHGKKVVVVVRPPA